MAPTDRTALNTLYDYLKDKQSLHLLDLLPHARELNFSHQKWHGDAHHTKLLVGSSGNEQCWAYLLQYGDKPREVRFFVEAPDRRPQPFQSNDVRKIKLNFPFSCVNTSNSQSDKRKLTILIKYYFFIAGHIDDIGAGQMGDFNYRLLLALQQINGPQSGESGSTGNKRTGSNSTRTGPHKSIDDEVAQIRKELEGRDCVELLDEIPTTDELHLEPQGAYHSGNCTSACSHRLLLGTDDEDKEIWAYMVKFGTKSHHEVRYHVSTKRTRNHELESRIHPNAVIKSSLFDPFPYCTKGLKQNDRARLMMMVKFYFMAAGKLDPSVKLLQETNDFLYRFRILLEFIHHRKESAKSLEAELEEEDYEEEMIDNDIDKEAEAVQEANEEQQHSIRPNGASHDTSFLSLHNGINHLRANQRSVPVAPSEDALQASAAQSEQASDRAEEGEDSFEGELNSGIFDAERTNGHRQAQRRTGDNVTSDSMSSLEPIRSLLARDDDLAIQQDKVSAEREEVEVRRDANGEASQELEQRINSKKAEIKTLEQEIQSLKRKREQYDENWEFLTVKLEGVVEERKRIRLKFDGVDPTIRNHLAQVDDDVHDGKQGMAS